MGIVYFILWVAESMFGDSIVRWLAEKGMSPDPLITFLLSWMFASPWNGISILVVVLVISFLINKYRLKKEEKEVPITAESKDNEAPINLNRKIKFSKWDDLGKDMGNYSGLIVENHSNTPIDDCIVTLEEVEPVYFSDGILVSEFEKNLFQGGSVNGIMRLGRLRWRKNELDDADCAITLPPRSKEEVIYVVYMGTGNLMSVIYDQRIEQGFGFTYCREPTNLNSPAGLFKIRLRLNGNVAGRQIKPKFFKGFIYVKQKGNIDIGWSSIMYLDEGDPLKSTKVPKPKSPPTPHEPA